MIDMNAIANAAAEQDEVPGAGGFKRELPRVGPALLRLQSYLELGLHKAKNPAHKPKREVRLRFELLHPDHMISGEKDDGTKYNFPMTLDVYTNVGGPTSKFGKLFAKMNYDNDASFMYQLIGKSFLGGIVHNTVGEGKDAKTYVNLQDEAGNWDIGAPLVAKVDPATGLPSSEKTPVPVPELDNDPQMFLYNKAGLTDDVVKQMWDSIFIEGEWEATDTKPAKSKNWIQEKIRTSLDFDGSATQRVDTGATLELPETDTPEPPVEVPADDTDPLKAIGL